MILAIGCDHIVTSIKNEIKKLLIQKGHTIIDCGTYDSTRTHYPIYGFEVARQVVTNKANLGIVICGTGVGITNSANKVKGARVCLTRDIATAIAAKKYYDANIIGIGGRITGLGLMEEIIDSFIKTDYQNKNNDTINKVNKKIVNQNFDICQMDKQIVDWQNGKYCEGEKQDTVPLPIQWGE